MPGLTSSTRTTGSGKDALTLRSQLAIATGPGGSVLTLQPSGKTRLTLRRFSPSGASLDSKTAALHVSINTSFPESSGLEYTVTPLGIAVASNGTQFIAFEEQICSISRNNRCRAYQSTHPEIFTDGRLSEAVGQPRQWVRPEASLPPMGMTRW